MIIAITDRTISRAPFTEQVEAIASARPDMIILREKDLPEKEYERLAKECLRICDRHSIRFCVNSFISVAVALGSERIQLPFSILLNNKDRLKYFKDVWTSVHSLSEAKEAEKMGVTHLIYGNVFETSCKPGAEGKGVRELKKICGSVNIPVFAVGGIDAGAIGEVIGTGCKGVCVRGPLMEAEDPHTVMRMLRCAL